MVVSDIYTLEELMELEKHNQAERSEWILNPPEPPGLRSELVDFVKEAIVPCERRFSPSKKTIRIETRDLFPFQSLFGFNPTIEQSSRMMRLLAMAYANLAHLKPQHGLYSSVVPPLIYALMGTSRDIVIGAVAVDPLLLSSMIQNIDPAMNQSTYKRLVFTATFFAGVFQAAFGLLRLGVIVDFLSRAATIGFMGGAAIVIGLQQLKWLFAIDHYTQNCDIISVFKAVWGSFHEKWRPYNFILGCFFLGFILIARSMGRRNKKFFWLQAVAPFLTVVLSTLVVLLKNAQKHGVEIVKDVKAGPVTEATAVGRSFASIKGYYLDANKEMVALGVMNIIGSFTSCYVASSLSIGLNFAGSFSRTAVNFSSGSETLASNIVMSITVLISLQLLTTRNAILASIILSTIPGLINLSGVYNVWKVDKLDFLACLAAFIGVLFSGVETGLLAAETFIFLIQSCSNLLVTISFTKIILISIRPGIETLGRIPGTDAYRDVHQYPMVIQVPGFLIIRVKERYYFSIPNSSKDGITIKFVILDMSNTTGIATLEELHSLLLSHELAIANPRSNVIHKLRLADFLSKIGGRVYLNVGEAIDDASLL
ncbi:hypothetical protein UlMin_038622 [Ulmus minor]